LAVLVRFDCTQTEYTIKINCTGHTTRILKVAQNGHLVRKLFQPEEFYAVL
jgi:hypothetical protein